MIGWRRPKTAFALSGGGARGAMQVGILRALLERKIYPDFIVGVSAGAWNGVWLASRPHADDISGLEQAWLRVSRLGPTIRWWSLVRNRFRRRLSRSDGGGLARLAAYHLGQLGVRDFADLQVPLHIAALDLTDGRKAIFSAGLLAPAVLASYQGCFPRSYSTDTRMSTEASSIRPGSTQPSSWAPVAST